VASEAVIMVEISTTFIPSNGSWFSINSPLLTYNKRYLVLTIYTMGILI
jgi:hypothetical protein